MIIWQILLVRKPCNSCNAQSIFILSSSASKNVFLHLFMKRRWIRNFFSFDWMFFRGCVSFCQNVIWREEHLAMFFFSRWRLSTETTSVQSEPRGKRHETGHVTRILSPGDVWCLNIFFQKTSWLYSFKVADLRSWKKKSENRICYWCMGRRIRYSGGPFRSVHPSYSLRKSCC